MKRLLCVTGAVLFGTLLGGIGGVVVAQAVPKCGEDCFAFTGILITAGAVAGGSICGAASALGRGRMDLRAWLWISLIVVVLVSGARWATWRHFSQLRDVQGQYRIDRFDIGFTSTNLCRNLAENCPAILGSSS